MSGGAILMMIVGILIIWGGLGSKYCACSEKRKKLVNIWKAPSN